MEVANAGVLAGPPQGSRYPQLIIAILPNAAPDCRRAVKHWGDIQHIISTQCVVSHPPFHFMTVAALVLTYDFSQALPEVEQGERPVLQQRRAQVGIRAL